MEGRAIVKGFQSDPKPKVTASSTPKPAKKVTAEPIASNIWNDLNQQVTAIINENPKLDISVAITDVVTNTKANYGIQDNFAGASTTKVLTAVTFLHEAEQGRQSLTKQFGGMTAKQHIKLMINQSNNESWNILNTQVTYKKIEEYARSIGVSSYSAKGNVITASDEALVLQKLYNGDLLTDANKKLLLSYMQDTNNEAMIPKAIPEGATIYHKYGQLEDRLHDAAIVEYKERPVVLVIYTKGGAADGSNYSARTQLIQKISSTVFATIYQ